MRYDSEHKVQTRERLLTEAAAAIRADGPERVSVANVMNRAGLTHGAFYAYFASKDQLLADAIDKMFSDVRVGFFEHDGDEPRDALARYVDYYLSMAHVDARDRGCPVPILAGETHRLPEEARRRFVEAVGRMKERIVALLERSGVDEAIGRADSAVAEMVGAVSLARLARDRDASEALLANARRSVGGKLAIDGQPHAGAD